jgi:restriction endonuclease
LSEKTLSEFFIEKVEEYRKIPALENHKCFRDMVLDTLEEWFKHEQAFYEKPENSIGILAFLDRERKALASVPRMKEI